MKRIFGSTDLTPSINSKNLSQAINLTAGATATGTTPTTWTNSSSLRRTGATLSLESPNIQPAPGQWLDSSSNNLHAFSPQHNGRYIWVFCHV